MKRQAGVRKHREPSGRLNPAGRRRTVAGTFCGRKILKRENREEEPKLKMVLQVLLKRGLLVWRMIRFQFDSIKTTQAAAFLLERHHGGMSKGCLLKMLYLTDRELLAKRGQPLTGDQPVSMENGPVLSKTYDLMKGAGLEVRSYWEQHISDAKKGKSYVTLKKKPGTDHLSKNEIRTLTEVDEKFG